MLNRDLLRFEKKQKYCCYDFESFNTNLVRNNTPWQVSWLTFDLYNNYESYDFYVNWGRVPSKEVQELTGYSQKRMDEEGRDPTEIYELFDKYISNDEYLLVGHNLLGFDTFVKAQWSLAVNKKVDYNYTKKIIDTLSVAKAYRFNKSIDRDNFLAWSWQKESFYTKGKSMKCTLSDLAKEFDIPVDSVRLHQSDYDIELNREVFRKLIWAVEV